LNLVDGLGQPDGGISDDVRAFIVVLDATNR
jgi:hypothetical protein